MVDIIFGYFLILIGGNIIIREIFKLNYKYKGLIEAWNDFEILKRKI